MSNFIYGYESWRKFYSSSAPIVKKNIWIYIKFSNDQEIYLKDYSDWGSVREFVDENNLDIHSVGLRYKSHQIEVDTKDSEAVYVVRSAKGEFGGSTKNCYTIGSLQNNKMNKKMWLTPELIEECSYVDDLDNCFVEAIIYHGTRKTEAFQ